MPPTKMLPVRGSLREFQELDSSAQDLQSQPRHHEFSICSKKTLTKKVAGLISVGLFCGSTIFLEYKMLLLFGAAFVVFAAACALAVISRALYRAPEGDERADGLHIQQHNRSRPFLWHVRQARQVFRSSGPMSLSNLPPRRTWAIHPCPGSVPNEPL